MGAEKNFVRQTLRTFIYRLSVLSYTHYDEVAELFSGLTFATISAPAHLHSIFLDCTPAKSNRYLISIFTVSSFNVVMDYLNSSERM